MVTLHQLLSFSLIIALATNLECSATTLPEPVKQVQHRIKTYTKYFDTNATQEERTIAKKTALKDGAIIGGSIGVLVLAGTATIIFIKKIIQFKKQKNSEPIDLSSKKSRNSTDSDSSISQNSDSENEESENSENDESSQNSSNDESADMDEADEAIQNVIKTCETFYSEFEKHPIINQELPKLRNALDRLEQAKTQEEKEQALAEVEAIHRPLVKTTRIYKKNTI